MSGSLTAQKQELISTLFTLLISSYAGFLRGEVDVTGMGGGGGMVGMLTKLV